MTRKQKENDKQNAKGLHWHEKHQERIIKDSRKWIEKLTGSADVDNQGAYWETL